MEELVVSVPDRDHDIPGIVAPPPLIYAAGLLLGWLIHRWYPRAWLPYAVARPLGVLASIVGLVGVFAVLAFRRAGTSPNPWRPTRQLVTDGPYRVSRNPMYVGFTLWYIGISGWGNSLWPILLLPVVLLIMQRGVIAREEAYLERRFGNEYRDYRKRVRRWL